MTIKKGMLIGIIGALLVLTAFIKFSSIGTNQEIEENIIDQSRGAGPLNIEQLANAPENSSAKGMKEVATNQNFALYLDPLTTDIAVLDKKTGLFTHSNPNRGIENLDMDETQVGAYGPIIEMQYTNLSGKDNKYSSYTNSVLLEQFELYEIEDGVRIVYDLGLDESKRLLPPVLTEGTYNKLLEELTDDEKADFKPLFRRIKTESIPKEEEDALLRTYPKLKEENLYILRDIKKYDKNVLEGILKAHQFTLEDIEKEITYVGYERDEANVVFTVPIDLKIDEQGFVASVDCTYIEEPDDFKISELTVLRGFGATNENEGFLFIPDGSGVLFNLTSNDPVTYSKQTYGADQIITAPYKNGYFMPSVMPVFGIKNPHQALFGIIEEGEAVTNVIAASKSDMTPLAWISPAITVNARDYQNYGNLKTNPSGVVLPADDPQAKVSIRYFFMNEEDVDYSDMAQLYQNYLVERGVLTKQETQGATPLYVEMPGAIEKELSTAGIPVKKKIALTSYNEVQEILELLIDNGAKGLKLRYTGWINEGLHNSVFNQVDFIDALGSKKELKNLLTFAEQNGISVFLDTQFDRVYKDKSFDGFKYSRDASRQLDHKVGVAGNYNPASLEMIDESKYYLVSPSKMVQFASSYFKALAKEEIQAGISLGTMGRHLNGDYKVESTITREQSEKYYEEIFSKVKDDYDTVLVEQGNAYTWPYVTDIVNLPVGGSELYNQAQAIPFVQMVLHGYVDYAAIPLNLSSDLAYETLKAIETGSGIYAQMMYEGDMVLVDTEFNDRYSLNYRNQWEQVLKVYKEVAKILDEVTGEPMIKHEKLAEHVYGTTYANGKQIIVNYQDEAWSDASITVDARGYAIREVK